jgi:hypothetical protein
MGQIFSKLTQPNTALATAGGPAFVGNPSQVLGAANASLPSADAMLGPNVLNPNTSVPSLPFIRRPSVTEAAQAGALPGSGEGNVFSPGLSKLGKLGVLLTSGVQGALAGRAAQEQMIAASGGRRAGGIGTGFTAGVQLPFLRQSYQNQANQAALQNQLTAADIGQKQAQTQLTQRQSELMGQSVPVTLPNGQTVYVPGNQAGGVLGNLYKGSAAAGINAQSRLTSDEFKARLQQGQIAFVRPGTDPQTGQFGMLGYNKQGDFIGHLPGAIDPSTLPTTSTSQQWLETSPGVWSLVSKTSTSQKSVPSGQPQAGGRAALPFLPRPQAQGQPQTNSPGPTPRLANQPRQIFGDAVGIAYDPKTNEYVQTTPKDAQANGYQQFQKITAKESEENRQLNNRLADVATKLTRYEDAIHDPAISAGDKYAMSKLLGEDAFRLGVSHIELPVDFLNKLDKARTAGNISPAAQKALIAYYNARESMVGYQRVLSGGARSNEKAMQLNLDALPNPLQPVEYQDEALRQFKENLTIAGQGLPRMPGITRAQDILNGGKKPVIDFNMPRPFVVGRQ